MTTRHTPTPLTIREFDSETLAGPGFDLVLHAGTRKERNVATVHPNGMEPVAMEAAFIVQAVNSHDALLEAAKAVIRLYEEALPKFNWGASALDANAIKLLNEVPGQLRAAIAAATSMG